MYINFWYPIARAEEVIADKPLRVELLGLPFVTFRDDEGAAHVLSDTCVHRGGSLSQGRVRGGGAVCPYHGWEFGGDGKCRKIPSLKGIEPPARAKVDSYPVQEKYGIVFAFLGDLPEQERPPLYEIEEYDNGEWKAKLYVYELQAYYERSIENGMDPIHNEFVHPMQGAPMMSPEKQRTPVPTTDIPWGAKFYEPFGDKLDYDTDLNDQKTGERVGAAGSWFQGPNQLVTWIDLTATNSFHQYMFEAPINDELTKVFFINMRNWLMEDTHDARIEEVTLQIVHEDVAVLEALSPIRTPDTNTREILVPGDAAVVRYRDFLKEWDQKGWRIDFRKLKETAGDVAYAIPSPGRRESGNWVLEPVPLIAPAEAPVRGKPEEIAELKSA